MHHSLGGKQPEDGEGDREKEEETMRVRQSEGETKVWYSEYVRERQKD